MDIWPAFVNKKAQKQSHRQRKTFHSKYVGWFVFGFLVFLTVLVHNMWLIQAALIRLIAEKSSSKWRQLGRQIQSTDDNNVTCLTLSSLASISTTSVSTSSIFALENKSKGRFLQCCNCFFTLVGGQILKPACDFPRFKKKHVDSSEIRQPSTERNNNQLCRNSVTDRVMGKHQHRCHTWQHDLLC